MIVVFFIFWGTLAPIINFISEPKYLSITYALVLALYILVNKKILLFRFFPMFYMYMSLIVVMAFVHPHLSSVLNLGSMFVSMYVIALVARKSVIDLPVGCFEKFIGVVLAAEIFLVMIISSLLTALSVKGAPNYFFWDSFISNKRLLLMNGAAGQTITTWLIPFSFVYFSCSLRASHKINFWLFMLLITYAILEVYSRNRIALIFIGIMLAAYVIRVIKFKHSLKAYIFIWPMIMASFIAVLFYSLIPFSSGIHAYLVESMSAAQKALPEVRIYSPGYGITTGRDILNAALFKVSMNNPFTGYGNNAGILKYGVTKFGAIAYHAKHVADSESSFRLAVAYGWFYYFSVLALILSPLVNKGWKNVAAVFTVLIVLFTFIFEGAFENLYGQGSIFMFLILSYYFRTKLV
jgi:hypothetical protein